MKPTEYGERLCERSKRKRVKNNFKVWGLRKKRKKKKTRRELPLTETGRINFLIGFLSLTYKS